MMLGRHCVGNSSNIQSTIGFSSGESEWYGLAKGSAADLGLLSTLRDGGIGCVVGQLGGERILVRQGLGRMRHVQTRCLWVQERAREGHLKVLPVRGKNSLADFFIKAVNGVLREKNLRMLGFVRVPASGKHKQVLRNG